MTMPTGPAPSLADRYAVTSQRLAARGPLWWLGQAFLTIVALGLIGLLGRGLWRWGTREARWGVVTDNLRLFAVGTYPADQLWRPALALVLVLVLVAATLLSRRHPARWLRLRPLLGLLWLLILPAVLALLRGVAGPTVVPAQLWGGLLLTLVLASVSIAASFPLGVLLALGRRSSLPLVHYVCVVYIEVIRGVPLVTVLYMAAIVLPLVLPDGLRPDNVLRAAAGLSFFNAAYIAEDVRGGLAGVGRGQYEAGRALGLSSISLYRIVILPQAIRTVIPSLVGQFISLFKDTSLVIIIGLRELLGIARAVVNQPAYLGLYRETLLFVALIDFVFCFSLSRASRRIERDTDWERR